MAPPSIERPFQSASLHAWGVGRHSCERSCTPSGCRADLGSGRTFGSSSRTKPYRASGAVSTSARHQPSSDRVIGYTVPSTSSCTRSGRGAHTANSVIDALQQRDGQLGEQVGGGDLPTEPACAEAVLPCSGGKIQKRFIPACFGEPDGMPGRRGYHVGSAEEGRHMRGGRALGEQRPVATADEGGGLFATQAQRGVHHAEPRIAGGVQCCAPDLIIHRPSI